MTTAKGKQNETPASKSKIAVNIFQDLGLENLSEKEREEIILRIGEILQKKIILRVLDELNEEDQNEFEKIIGEKGDDEEAVLNFLRSKLPNLDELVNEEIEEVKKETHALIEKLSE